MSLPLLLLLLVVVCSAQASHYRGIVMTYYPKNTNADGSMTVDLHYKWNFHACADITSWTCFSGNCGNVSSAVLNKVDEEIGTLVWCQTEGIMTRQVSINTPFQLWSDGGAWIDYIKNGIIAWRALTLVELRNRSDTNQANRSPQTTILPVLRVPSNCQRDFNLLAFDPDGDEVKCRYGNTTLSECYDCTPPSVLNLSTHVYIPTRGPNALDHIYANIPGSYKALPRPHFGLSEHVSLLLQPINTQLIKRVKATIKTVKVWADEATAALQDCFGSTDWSVFREATTQERHINLEEYTSSMTSYISKCVDDVEINGSMW